VKKLKRSNPFSYWHKRGIADHRLGYELSNRHTFERFTEEVLGNGGANCSSVEIGKLLPKCGRKRAQRRWSRKIKPTIRGKPSGHRVGK
jgi:hypothetical protein